MSTPPLPDGYKIIHDEIVLEAQTDLRAQGGMLRVEAHPSLEGNETAIKDGEVLILISPELIALMRSRGHAIEEN